VLTDKHLDFDKLLFLTELLNIEAPNARIYDDFFLIHKCRILYLYNQFQEKEVDSLFVLIRLLENPYIVYLNFECDLILIDLCLIYAILLVYVTVGNDY
jgi:hypothetical protein